MPYPGGILIQEADKNASWIRCSRSVPPGRGPVADSEDIVEFISLAWPENICVSQMSWKRWLGTGEFCASLSLLTYGLSYKVLPIFSL